MHKAQTFEPVTLGHIRGHGVTRLLVRVGLLHQLPTGYVNSSHCQRDNRAMSPLKGSEGGDPP